MDTITQPAQTIPDQRRFRFVWHASIGRTLFTIMSGVGLMFLSLPLIGLLVRAIRTDAWRALSADSVLDAILLSAITTLISLLLTILVGTPLAYVLARIRFPGRRIANVLVELPIVLPPAVAGLALLSAFGRRGLFGATLESLDLTIAFSTAAVVIAQTFVAAPFFIRSASVGFASIPHEIEEAAKVDGAGEMALFWFITLPMASRALGAGLVLSWARAMGEFGATIMFAGSLQGKTQTMPLLIYETFNTNVNAAIAAGLILVGVALVALLLAGWLRGEGDDYLAKA